ncbi:MAG: serine/threonine protein kinase [Myxococcales bacterium]|nr:serine/threonine protein kinase [Myxococcales bacterium]MBK7190883.1 serine/threonine protein kinase [Myxococcales bacterium]MBP6846985.1 serine/threonine protein kinase [Kofleriaceae bacterium]
MRPVPVSVGKYQVIDRLAVGGMAELFKAKASGEHGFAKVVVLKKILPHLAADPTFVQMFMDEARLTAQLDHPNIVHVFELGMDADTPYIAMQYVDGIDVLALLRECARTQIRLPAQLAALIARDTLDALDYAHHAVGADGRPLGLVHRDVSPGNVLVSRRGDVKLTDFGIARAVERNHKTEAGMLKGKYGYMSPEQVSGAELDGRSDVFALGIVLAEMAMARRLFSAPSDLDVLLMVRDANLERLERYAGEVPTELRVITEKALQRRVEDRWQSAGEMRDALTGWLHRNGRPDARDLAAFVARVQAAPSMDDSAVVRAPQPEIATLSGPATQMSQARAIHERRVARAEFIAGVSGGAPDEVVEDEPSHDVAIETDLGPQERGPRPTPTEAGDLRQISPLRLLHRLTIERATGLLVLEGRAGILKEAYFGVGDPQFVSSNVTSERFGDFLVAQGALTPQALARAVSVMPHFGGRLADTLVGLGLVRAIDAYRLLSQQVSAKLIDVCTWPKGRYRWYAGRANPFQVKPLHLDGFRILGAGATALDVAFVDDWAAAHERDRLSPARPAATLPDFGLGEAPARVHALAANTTVGDVLARVRSADARTNFLRLLYLLIECEYVSAS